MTRSPSNVASRQASTRRTQSAGDNQVARCRRVVGAVSKLPIRTATEETP